MLVLAKSCCFRRVQLCCIALELDDEDEDDDDEVDEEDEEEACLLMTEVDWRCGSAAKTACRNKSRLPTSCCNS